MTTIYETILDVGDEVPGFDLESQVGRIVFRDIIYGRWCILVTIDTAFEPAATTDLGMLARLKEEFDHREIFVLVISSDTSTFFRNIFLVRLSIYFPPFVTFKSCKYSPMGSRC